MNFKGLGFAVLMTAALPCAAQWKSIGPFGGSAAAVVRDPANPDTLLAAARDGLVFRSEDGGESWKSMPFPRELTTMVRAMAAAPGDPATYYIAASDPKPGECGLYLSRGSDGPWEAVTDLCAVDVFSLAVFHGDPHIVAAGGHDGVYLTRDAGQTWKRISPAANRELQPIMSLAFDPANSEILYAGTPHLPWRTMNGGRAWQSVHRGLIDDSDVFSLEVDTTNPRRVYASACSGIYLSQDRSDNWVKLAGVPRDSRRTYTIRQDPGNPSVVYAGTSRGLWKSLDSGGKWTQISPLVVKSIAFDPRDSRRFVMATDNTGLLETSDGGATTRAVNAGFGDRKLRAIQAAPGGLLTSVLYEGGESGLYRYSREQNRWSAVAADPGARLNFLSLTTIDRNGLLATTHQGAMISTDGGRNWNAMEGPWRSSRLQSFSVLPGSPAVIFAATEAGVYRSENRGGSWELVTENKVRVDALYASAGSGESVLAMTSEGLYFSGDRGRKWTKAEKPPGSDLYDAALQSDGPILAATSRGLYRSTDQARTWRPVNGAPGTGTVRAVALHPSRPLAFVAHHSTVYVSGDGGESWSALPSKGLERSLLQALVMDPEDPEHLYALAKGRGVFVFTLSDAGESVRTPQ